jgi:hypothetical protein
VKDPAPVIHSSVAMVNVGGGEYVTSLVVLINDTLAPGGGLFVLYVCGISHGSELANETK